MKQLKVYTEADLKFQVKDEAEKQAVLDYLNNPKVLDLAFKEEVAQFGPREIIKRSDAKILKQYREAKVPLPKRY
jgi:hypothetical protein